jgi:hypothetical protein
VLELDDFGPNPDTGFIGNAALWPAFHDACYAYNIYPCSWFTRGENVRDTPPDAWMTAAETESEDDRRGAVDNAHLIPGSVEHRFVVSTLTPYSDGSGNIDQGKAQEVINAGYGAMPECYVGSNPHSTPPNEAFVYQQLGWHIIHPVFGVYNAPLADYEQWMEQWPSWSAYLAENVL